MQDAIFASLGKRGLLLTGNRRLARHWNTAYGKRQVESGRTVWPAPSVHAWMDWVRQSIEERFPELVQTSKLVEQRAWIGLVGQGDFFDTSATAALAANAWDLCQQYEVPMDHPAFSWSEDAARFKEWAESFNRLVEENRWLPTARQEQWLCGNLRQHAQETWLDGFDEVTPAQNRLMDALNCTTVQGASFPANTVMRTACADAAAEVEAAARWARRLLEEGTAKQVGVVVPDLATQRKRVDRVFEDTFGARVFNVSLGQPLNEWPLVSDALLCLRWLSGPLDIDSASILLRSPFLRGAVAERSGRIQFDLDLREHHESTAGLERLESEGPDILGAAFGQAAGIMRSQPRRQSPGEWARLFPKLLNAVGWPGDRPLSSAEYQTQVRWQQALIEYTCLDAAEKSITFGEAVSMLEQTVASVIFQPETAELPVQILESLQAAGARFDALWVMGMSASSWPQPARPNPFLPAAVRSAFDLPHSSAARELAYARGVTQRLLQSADEIVFSYPERDKDEELLPSGLIMEFPEGKPTLFSSFGHSIAEPLEQIDDQSAPPLAAGEDIRGGTSIISWQSKCPFRAFATVRLHAQQWNEPEPGISAAERGKAMHGALAALWERYRSREALARVEDSVRRESVMVAAATGCAEIDMSGREHLHSLETERIATVLEDWLGLDLSRDDFSVEPIEEPLDLSPAGIPAMGRPDRVDRLTNGATAIIDYKSTAPSIRTWAGDRPDDLQLPIYALASPEAPQALVFAQLKRGDQKFRGLAASEGLFQGAGVPEQGWEAQLEEWRAKITELWQEFQGGHAAVTPKAQGRCCIDCHLHSLCRIDETSTSLDEGDDDAASA